VHDSGAGNLPVHRVVIHCTAPGVGYPKASAKGTASGTAKYFQMQSAGGSAHYVYDAFGGAEHCVPDSVIAWHAPPNAHSIGIEICGEVTYTREQWLSDRVWPGALAAAARCRELCKRYGVPIRRLTVADLKAGREGVCGHVDVSNAFHMTDHSDPGPHFPWAEFMAAVNGKLQEEDDDMPEYVSLDLTKPQPVQAGQAARIVWDREWADTSKAHADGSYPGILSGGDEGAQFVATVNAYGVPGRWRLIETDPAKDYATSKNYPYSETAYGTVSGWCDKGQHLYLEFLPSADGEVHAAVKVNYWRR
jgi:hypothetical protein